MNDGASALGTNSRPLTHDVGDAVGCALGDPDGDPVGDPVRMLFIKLLNIEFFVF